MVQFPWFCLFDAGKKLQTYSPQMVRFDGDESHDTIRQKSTQKSKSEYLENKLLLIFHQIFSRKPATVA